MKVRRFEGLKTALQCIVASLYNITHAARYACCTRTLGLLSFTCSITRFMKVQQTGGWWAAAAAAADMSLKGTAEIHTSCSGVLSRCRGVKRAAAAIERQSNTARQVLNNDISRQTASILSTMHRYKREHLLQIAASQISPRNQRI